MVYPLNRHPFFRQQLQGYTASQQEAFLFERRGRRFKYYGRVYNALGNYTPCNFFGQVVIINLVR